MATDDQVRARRAENELMRQQIAEIKSEKARELNAANNDIAMKRADREHESLEAQLASLMAVRSSSEVSEPPPPDTTLVPGGVVAGPPVASGTPSSDPVTTEASASTRRSPNHRE